jgi:DnaA regulatory inactivator Hda
MAQLTLDLGQRPALDREDFLVAPSNRTAVAWIDRWPDWPGAALALYGPPGCGKTHLAQVWRAASGARAIEPAALRGVAPPDLLGASRTVLLDGLDSVFDGDPERERTVLHLHNMVVERGGHLLVAGRSAPARWPVALADLRSRLAALQAVELGAPDDSLIQAVLVKLFADRQLRVGAEVVRFLLTRMERSFESARSLVDVIDRTALESRREITVPLARAVLNDLMGRPSNE